MKWIFITLNLITLFFNEGHASMENPRFYADYVHLEKDMASLYQKLPQKKWKGIIGVARGGLYPCLFLAHKLNIRHIETLSLASYGQDEKQNHLKVLHDINFKDKNQGEEWLIIDDLADSGKTLAWLRQHLPKAHYAVVYAKPLGKSVVDTYGKEIAQHTWIEFSWEKDIL